MRRFTCTALLAALSGPVAHAQVIAANDQSSPTPTMWLTDVRGTNGAPIPLLTGPEARAVGMTYDRASNRLFWSDGVALRRAPFAGAGLVPVLIGNVNFGGSTAGVSLSSLGYNPGSGQLYGFNASSTPSLRGFVSIDPATGNATLLRQMPADCDFAGLAFDPEANRWYGVNNGTGTASGLSGRGLYQLDFISPTATYTKLANYPSGQIRVDDLSVGGGRAYMVNGSSRPTFVFNLGTGAYEANLPSPFISAGTGGGSAFLNSCPADLDLNGATAANDLTVMLGAYGASPAMANWNSAADIDRNGFIGANDLNILLLNYGCAR
ncbi:MAG: hypothetical protein IBJ11_08655 [Phycisphaerales bacterium]|nr:hypothetical protein [Phycisphaerales bacterium]